MKRCLDWIRADRMFLIVAPLFGLACMILTPPFQVADEPFHFYRIVQISQGGFIGERRADESGGEIPVALIRMVEDLFDGDHYSGEVRWDTEDWSKLRPYLTRSVDLSDRAFIDFRTRTLYAPLLYVPQVLGVGLAKALGVPPLWMVYAGRLFALLFFVAMVGWAIRLTPVCPWGFALVALLPAVMFQSASLSADSTVNAVLFLFIAMVFRMAYSGKARLTRGNEIALLAFAAVIGLFKAVYVPVLGLYFLIPPRHCGGRKRFGWLGAVIMGVAVLAAGSWALMIRHITVPLFEDVNEWEQIVFILRNPVHFLGMVIGRWLNAILYLFIGGRIGLLQEFVGMLGWYAAYVPISQICLGVLFWCAISEKNEQVAVLEWHRWFVAFLLLGTVLLVAAANSIVWLPPGSSAIALFGRYFHPIAPMTFLLLHNQNFRVTCHENWKWLIPLYVGGVVATTLYVLVQIY